MNAACNISATWTGMHICYENSEPNRVSLLEGRTDHTLTVRIRFPQIGLCFGLVAATFIEAVGSAGMMGS